MILLDTDVLIEIFDRRSVIGDEILKQLHESGDQITTSAINLHEVLYSLRKYAKPVDEALLLPVLDYTKRDAALSSRLQMDEEGAGLAMRRRDATIAAIAINNGALLCTLDPRCYDHLDNLRLLTQPFDESSKRAH